ncbi:hypothetical protein [Ruegeria lacuscaerulensis]|uniref:hypothetical protein n=1 Tax=Ruegeria lacuscaerulensis TaxID=55218 RepID=UPI00147DE2B4|nr:hypothetical protein [Ruegeria lacuscaerulensis]
MVCCGDNPFLEQEKLTGEWIEQMMKQGRDLRDERNETTFLYLEAVRWLRGSIG